MPGEAELLNALERVAEESFFATLDRPTGADWAEAGGASGEWLEACVRFRGPQQGALRCCLPSAGARELASAFLGAADDGGNATDIARDLTGELTNMICGRWLSAADPDGLYELEAPEVRVGVSCTAGWTLALINGGPVAIHVGLGEPR
jgi:hypothetical protein